MDSTMLLLLIVGVGLLNCFAGYRVFILTLAVLGAVLGGTVGYGLGEYMGPGAPALIGAVLGALLLGWITVSAYFLGIALLGALLFGAAGAALFQASGPVVQLIAGLLGGLVGALIATFLQRTILILGTAVQGALVAVLAGMVVFGRGSVADFQRLYGDVLTGAERLDRVLGHPLVLVGWAGLTIAGIIVQSPRARRLAERREQKRLELP